MIATGVRSQKEVAKLLGISRMRVIQLERAAIVKICRALDYPCPFVARVSGPPRRLRTHWVKR